MLLERKRLLVTGVVSTKSIAHAAARLALAEGAEVVLTGFGRGLRITERLGESLGCEVLEMDVTAPEQVSAVVTHLGAKWGALDGLLHAVAYAPANALDGGFLTAPWEDVATALHVSTYSFAALGREFAPLLAAAGGGSIVGLDFDAEVVWPGYDWMGVAKAGLESCARYLAHALGPAGTRVNLIAAGPLRTVAAGAIKSFEVFESVWQERAPLGWDDRDATAVGRAICALWSEWLPGVTGEVIHVDGGVHAIGGTVPKPAPAAEAEPELAAVR
ncbi:enoyl-ACP reductase FabI [Actinokineospora sp. NBRC 105648]|uniref:enoyl-ACP reductase FabI n=1 Tax=Actinokineospora sp. NBRC 105648 TaxID=3032206 RepID=UPI0024A16CDB|nr:enoyl-ACP reductase FabI [Actinokineospora sp. NBRC 105648]GLZ39225.1 enoyl-[acyl-carrier-protein] reductase [NADH] [Actinokineospora sp. NBRC 105648]